MGSPRLVGAASTVHATGVAPPPAGALVQVGAAPATLPLDELVRGSTQHAPAPLSRLPDDAPRLAAAQQAGGLHISPISVSATSEMLLPEHRAAISAGFGVPIVNTFGSTEGLVGVSAPDAEEPCSNSDLCIVELVDERNEPVSPGRPSVKVLLTNLYNRVQPLIRYELTDWFVERPPAPDHGHLRATVEGRSDDVLRFAGADVHPHVLRSVLVGAPAILDYRIRQTPRGVEIDALASGVLDVADLRTRLTSALASAGLRQPEVDVRVVDDLDRNAATGKLRRFLPLPVPTAVR